MPDYRIQILIDAKDRASGPLSKVGSALGNMGQIAGGIIGAQIFTKLARGLFDFASGAIQATANMQAMQVGLEGLIAREMAQGQTVQRLIEQQIALTDQQRLSLIELERSYPNLTAQLADLTAEYQKQVAATGANSAAALKLHIELTGLEAKVAQTGAQLNFLRDASDGVISVMQGVTTGTMSIGEAMGQAQGKAKELMAELANISILSPYQVEAVQNTFRMAMAFGFTSEQAKDFTKAILNVAAGTGASNEMLDRMAYNFAQIRLQGRVTAMDIRQLAMAGFDLTSVLRFAGEQVGVNIQTHEDFNKALAEGQITWEQFSKSFTEYSEKNFGGAAERMSRTLNGLKSTFKDLFVLTMPQILGPAAEKFTGFANGILDSVLKIRESGLLERLAEGLSAGVERLLASLDPVVGAFTSFFDALGNGATPAQAFADLVTALVGKDLAGQLFDVVAGARAFASWLRSIWDALAPTVDKIAEFIAQNVKLSDVAIAFGLIIASAVIPALASLAASLAPVLALIGLVALARAAWQNNWFGIRDTLTQAWQNTILPALQQLWSWLQVNIPLALQTLTTFWNTTLLPALQTFWAWVQTNILPLLQQLWTWLQVNIPLALQALSGFWQNTLLPAIQAVWNWLQTSLFPALAVLWSWLQTNIPLALQALSGFWQNTLLPAMQAVWSWMSTVALPFWQSVSDFFSATFSLAIEALAGLWQNILLPALQAVMLYVQDHVLPKLQNIADLVNNTVLPVLTTLGNWLSDAFAKAWDGIAKAIQGVTTMIKNMTTAIEAIELPDWLTPGSPTPFELGLRGIAGAVHDLNAIHLPRFQANLGMNGAGGGAQAAAPVYVTVNANVAGDVDVDYLAYRVAKKIAERQ